MLLKDLFTRRKKKKVFVLGLDCADPSLLFERWKDELPTFAKLTEKGAYGRLRSVDPPITSPAWTCMLSGKSPGELGLYGFRHRSLGSYEKTYFAFSDRVTCPRVWDVLSRRDRRVVLVGVPQTFPVSEVNGLMVSSFLTPSTESQYTYPPELKPEIERISKFDGEFSTEDRGYMLDVEEFRTSDKERVLDDIYRMTDKRFRVTEYLLQRDWDFFMTVFMGPDRIQHGFWNYMEEEQGDHEAGRYQDAILDYYRYLDREINELINKLDSNTSLLIVSDHGAKKLDGCIAINEWLREEGYLTLNKYPRESQRLREEWIDWSKTKAWGWGGYYGRLFINLEGREPQGVVPTAEYEDLRGELSRKLTSLTAEDGDLRGTRVYRPEDIYEEVQGDPPDLMVYFGDLSWRSSSSIGGGSVYLSENDTGPDHANHAREGILFARGNGVKTRGRLDVQDIRAVAPTIFQLLGEEIPANITIDPVHLSRNV